MSKKVCMTWQRVSAPRPLFLLLIISTLLPNAVAWVVTRHPVRGRNMRRYPQAGSAQFDTDTLFESLSGTEADWPSLSPAERRKSILELTQAEWHWTWDSRYSDDQAADCVACVLTRTLGVLREVQVLQKKKDESSLSPSPSPPPPFKLDDIIHIVRCARGLAQKKTFAQTGKVAELRKLASQVVRQASRVASVLGLTERQGCQDGGIETASWGLWGLVSVLPWTDSVEEGNEDLNFPEEDIPPEMTSLFFLEGTEGDSDFLSLVHVAALIESLLPLALKNAASSNGALIERPENEDHWRDFKNDEKSLMSLTHVCVRLNRLLTQCLVIVKARLEKGEEGTGMGSWLSSSHSFSDSANKRKPSPSPPRISRGRRRRLQVVKQALERCIGVLGAGWNSAIEMGADRQWKSLELGRKVHMRSVASLVWAAGKLSRGFERLPVFGADSLPGETGVNLLTQTQAEGAVKNKAEVEGPGLEGGSKEFGGGAGDRQRDREMLRSVQNLASLVSESNAPMIAAGNRIDLVQMLWGMASIGVRPGEKLRAEYETLMRRIPGLKNAELPAVVFAFATFLRTRGLAVTLESPPSSGTGRALKKNDFAVGRAGSGNGGGVSIYQPDSVRVSPYEDPLSLWGHDPLSSDIPKARDTSRREDILQSGVMRHSESGAVLADPTVHRKNIRQAIATCESSPEAKVLLACLAEAEKRLHQALQTRWDRRSKRWRGGRRPKVASFQFVSSVAFALSESGIGAVPSLVPLIDLLSRLVANGACELPAVVFIQLAKAVAESAISYERKQEFFSLVHHDKEINHFLHTAPGPSMNVAFAQTKCGVFDWQLLSDLAMLVSEVSMSVASRLPSLDAPNSEAEEAIRFALECAPFGGTGLFGHAADAPPNLSDLYQGRVNGVLERVREKERQGRFGKGENGCERREKEGWERNKNERRFPQPVGQPQFSLLGVPLRYHLAFLYVLWRLGNETTSTMDFDRTTLFTGTALILHRLILLGRLAPCTITLILKLWGPQELPGFQYIASALMQRSGDLEGYTDRELSILLHTLGQTEAPVPLSFLREALLQCVTRIRAAEEATSRDSSSSRVLEGVELEGGHWGRRGGRGGGGKLRDWETRGERHRLTCAEGGGSDSSCNPARSSSSFDTPQGARLLSQALWGIQRAFVRPHVSLQGEDPPSEATSVGACGGVKSKFEWQKSTWGPGRSGRVREGRSLEALRTMPLEDIEETLFAEAVPVLRRHFRHLVGAPRAMGYCIESVGMFGLRRGHFVFVKRFTQAAIETAMSVLKEPSEHDAFVAGGGAILLEVVRRVTDSIREVRRRQMETARKLEEVTVRRKKLGLPPLPLPDGEVRLGMENEELESRGMVKGLGDGFFSGGRVRGDGMWSAHEGWREAVGVAGEGGKGMEGPSGSLEKFFSENGLGEDVNGRRRVSEEEASWAQELIWAELEERGLQV
uniref:Telomere length regulation protein conserved domain-containing protein n=1 Tax=Chromera velia CCMP2878 TaxID=1169474 RepID=A0A0G4IDU9_9ALVE|eukprot:Cvel_2384.t1-p1 / transcript=Cvel_2384.t1 / gene=Cvel_2384 / organism=Chromera_velia_CCMP2878 / gene_product=hypothetical protein / transcript_product=hypothetical protein / location=Cvel_scaffold92:125197-131275(-) / protein_length=1449 / sequence_SO=supercontig / SO=protein_coding / is_pseudo=false